MRIRNAIGWNMGKERRENEEAVVKASGLVMEGTVDGDADAATHHVAHFDTILKEDCPASERPRHSHISAREVETHREVQQWPELL
jgi:hypothetical protein